MAQLSPSESIQKALEQFWQNVAPPQPALVAVSGGPDSLALLHTLWGMRESYPALQIQVAHFNHLIRGGNAQADAEFVAEFCQTAGLPFHLGQYDVPELAGQAGLSVEEAARLARYAWLSDLANRLGIKLVLVAHNADDQAETLLLRLLRGTGPAGLGGMRPLGPVPPIEEPRLKTVFPGAGSQEIQLGRPLLTVWRREIEAYCKVQKLNPRHDETNDQLDYRRNRLRHQLIPLLEKEYQPHLKSHLLRLAELTRAEQDWLEELTWTEFDRQAHIQTRPYHEVSFDPSYFAAQPLALQRRLVRQTVAHLRGLQNLEAGHIEAVLTLFSGTEVGRLTLPDGLVACRLKTKLAVFEPPSETLSWPVAFLTLPVPGTLVGPGNLWQLEARLATTLPSELKQPNKFRAWLDYAKIGPQLIVRPRHPGERFRPLGAPGRRKVQDVMLDGQLPRERRDSWPLVVRPAQGDTPEAIVWIPGLAVADEFRIEETTKEILDFRFWIFD